MCEAGNFMKLGGEGEKQSTNETIFLPFVSSHKLNKEIHDIID